MKPTYTFLVSIVLSTVCVFADPQPGRDVSSMSESEVAELSREELMALPLEDLMILADKLGVSVDELLNLKISVSSKKALNTRESPGIISLITDEEIANSGARDLIDVLQLIPGFGFGYDFEGIIGIGMRGIWGHEGKMLLLIDGQEMNELLFSTQPYGHHFDVGQIKRIEIMRGPGSCVYGGFAELGVINIITKKADDLNGFSVKSTYGRMLDANARTNLSIGFGKFHEKVEYSVLGFANSSKRTDTPYESDYGLYDASSAVMNISSYNINASLGVNGVKTRFIFDYYSPYTVDLLDTLDIPTQESFSTYLGEIKYDWFINNSTTITPKINLKHQYAWRCLEPDPELYYNKSVTRMTGSILANHDFSDMLNVVGGIESFSDYAINHDTAQDADVFANDETEVAYNNVSLFAQGLLKVKYANFILGGRFDRHNEYGSAFSPRLGVTGLINDAHYKVLFGGAFRAPGIENIALGPVDPERTYVFEIELGYRLAKSMFITANLFDITIHDPIVYYFEPDTSDPTGESGNDAYMNYPRTGSSGLELEYRFKKQWLSVTLGYSFYSAALLGESEDGISGYLDKNRVDSYSVPDGNGPLLGFPQHKINLISTIQLKNLSITPSLVWMHEKYAYAIDENDEDLYEQSDPVFMFNTWFRYKNLLIDGLTVGLGVFNILGAEYTYVQPYNDGHSPYPGQSRELVARISYEF